MPSTYAPCAPNTVVRATLLDLGAVYPCCLAGVRVAAQLQISNKRAVY
jgi:hypothetical protein